MILRCIFFCVSIFLSQVSFCGGTLKDSEEFPGYKTAGMDSKFGAEFFYAQQCSKIEQLNRLLVLPHDKSYDSIPDSMRDIFSVCRLATRYSDISRIINNMTEGSKLHFLPCEYYLSNTIILKPRQKLIGVFGDIILISPDGLATLCPEEFILSRLVNVRLSGRSGDYQLHMKKLIANGINRPLSGETKSIPVFRATSAMESSVMLVMENEAEVKNIGFYLNHFPSYSQVETLHCPFFSNNDKVDLGNIWLFGGKPESFHGMISSETLRVKNHHYVASAAASSVPPETREMPDAHTGLTSPESKSVFKIIHQGVSASGASSTVDVAVSLSEHMVSLVSDDQKINFLAALARWVDVESTDLVIPFNTQLQRTFFPKYPPLRDTSKKNPWESYSSWACTLATKFSGLEFHSPSPREVRAFFAILFSQEGQDKAGTIDSYLTAPPYSIKVVWLDQSRKPFGNSNGALPGERESVRKTHAVPVVHASMPPLEWGDRESFNKFISRISVLDEFSKTEISEMTNRCCNTAFSIIERELSSSVGEDMAKLNQCLASGLLEATFRLNLHAIIVSKLGPEALRPYNNPCAPRSSRCQAHEYSREYIRKEEAQRRFEFFKAICTSMQEAVTLGLKRKLFGELIETFVAFNHSHCADRLLQCFRATIKYPDPIIWQNFRSAFYYCSLATTRYANYERSFFLPENIGSKFSGSFGGELKECLKMMNGAQCSLMKQRWEALTPDIIFSHQRASSLRRPVRNSQVTHQAAMHRSSLRGVQGSKRDAWTSGGSLPHRLPTSYACDRQTRVKAHPASAVPRPTAVTQQVMKDFIKPEKYIKMLDAITYTDRKALLRDMTFTDDDRRIIHILKDKHQQIRADFSYSKVVKLIKKMLAENITYYVLVDALKPFCCEGERRKEFVQALRIADLELDSKRPKARFGKILDSPDTEVFLGWLLGEFFTVVSLYQPEVMALAILEHLTDEELHKFIRLFEGALGSSRSLV